MPKSARPKSGQSVSEAVDPLHAHLAILGKRDPHIRRAIKEIGLPASRRGTPGFPALARIIIDQQVSTAAGAAIWKKLAKACGGKVTPGRVLDLGENAMRACGLSGQKARYVCGIAEAITAKQLDLAALETADDATARAALTAMKGVGDWTADIYLMFAMGRTDIWPVADLALQHGIRLLHGRNEKPTTKMMEAIAEPWRPYRSGAAILLWQYYGATRKKGPKP